MCFINFFKFTKLPFSLFLKLELLYLLKYKKYYDSIIIAARGGSGKKNKIIKKRHERAFRKTTQQPSSTMIVIVVGVLSILYSTNIVWYDHSIS